MQSAVEFTAAPLAVYRTLKYVVVMKQREMQTSQPCPPPPPAASLQQRRPRLRKEALWCDEKKHELLARAWESVDLFFQPLAACP